MRKPSSTPRLLLQFLRVPESLLLLVLHASHTIAQNALTLNQGMLVSTDAPPPSAYTLPPSTGPLTVSIALCSTLPEDAVRFFVTNNSAGPPPGPGGGEDVFEIPLWANGTGWFTLASAADGGQFAVDFSGGQVPFEVAVSDGDSLHSPLPSLPLLGDTTSNQALLFSPPLPNSFTPPPEPTYPNYTLPVANLTPPTPPDQMPDFTLFLGPTSVFPSFDTATYTHSDGLPVSACALRSVPGVVVLTSDATAAGEDVKPVLRDARGWRVQWLVGGLLPSTNYTAYVTQGGSRVAGPINLFTKSGTFPCPLVHSLPYCPLISYAVPLSAPPSPLTAHDATTLPSSLVEPILSYMTNFTTSLLTFACGRDWYSPVQSCASCQTAYRNWLCSISFPRCGETIPATLQPSAPTDAQQPLVAPALVPQTSNTPQPRSQLARNPNLPPFNAPWMALLPCIETCHAVDRACPDFLGFRCPVPRFTARDSYAVGYIDGDGDGDGKGEGGEWVQLGGRTGVAQDRWGNVWCNGS